MGHTRETYFPPEPKLTEVNLPRQPGKVFLVTGGTGGVGEQLSRMLYHAGGKVYMSGRNASKAEATIARIEALPVPDSTAVGELIFLPLDLSDLSAVKPAVKQFLAAETRLDVLFLNAGVSHPPAKLKGKQGHDLSWVTNCYSHHLLSQLLIPILTQTAASKATSTESPGVRVIWTSSMVTDLHAPRGGINPNKLVARMPHHTYKNTKTANWFLADSLAKQIGRKWVLSVVVNPGNLKTDVLRHVPFFVTLVVNRVLHPAKFGAYTNLWAGFSEDLKISDGGAFVIPWGRRHPAPRQDLLAAMKTEDEGGSGIAARVVRHCDEQIKEYLD